MSAPPWSPSAAREKARAALCTCRTQHPRDLAEEARLVKLLADERAFDPPELSELETYRTWRARFPVCPPHEKGCPGPATGCPLVGCPACEWLNRAPL